MEVLSFLYARHEYYLRGESPKVIRNGGVNEVGIRWKDNALILKVSRTHGDVDVFDGT